MKFAQLSLVFGLLLSQVCFSQTIYRTIADGSWAGPNWHPCPPPAILDNAEIIINHHIVYTSQDIINHWNVPTGKITILKDGMLKVFSNNNDIRIKNGFGIYNYGKLEFRAGLGVLEVDNKSKLVNHNQLQMDAHEVIINSDIANLFAPSTHALSLKD